MDNEMEKKLENDGSIKFDICDLDTASFFSLPEPMSILMWETKKGTFKYECLLEKNKRKRKI